MQLRELTDALNEIAPTRNAESWDNVGLLVGDPQQDVSVGARHVSHIVAPGKRAATRKPASLGNFFLSRCCAALRG